jgi:hypothetical protein
MPEIQAPNNGGLTPEELGLVDGAELGTLSEEEIAEELNDDGSDEDYVDEEDFSDPAESEDEEKVIVTPVARPRTQPRRRRRRVKPEGEAVSPLKQLETQGDKEIYGWLSELGSGSPIEVILKRITPPEWQGMYIEGTICTYDEPINEEMVKMVHGGGKYQAVVRKVRPNGQKVYAGARTFKIAGHPKIDSLPGAAEHLASQSPPPMAMPDDGLSSQAMNTMVRMTEEARKEAREARGNSGMDWQAMETVLAPLRDQVALLQKALSEKDSQVVELLGKPPDKASEDRLLNIMENKESGYANSIEALRAQHGSELSQLREFNLEEIKRRESRFEKELAHLRSATEREVDSLKLVNAQSMESQKHGYEMRIDGMKDIQKRLERELDSTKTELAELRGKKDVTPVDQIQNMVTLKSAFEALGPSASEEPDKSTFERVAETVMNSPLMEGVAARIADNSMGGGEEELARRQQMIAEQQQGQEMVQVRGPDGKVQLITRAHLEQIKRQAAEKQAQGPQFNAAEIGQAVQFMAQAQAGGTDPATFARTVSVQYPVIIDYVKHRGVDGVMADMAKLADGNPITTTVAGRAYAREVARILFGGEGSTEGANEHPDPPIQPTSPVESQ